MPWHEVLFALYGLEEVERVDGIERDGQAIREAFLTNYATAGKPGARRLEREHSKHVQRMVESAYLDGTDIDITPFLTWPGMPGYVPKKKAS